MRRFVLAFVFACVLASLGFLAAPAKAGEYYGNGYYGHRSNVHYTSSCCYRKVVRHVTTTRYVRVDPGYRTGYYDRPYRDGSYYDRPYRSGYYDRPYRPAYVDAVQYDDGYGYGLGVRRNYGGAYAHAEDCTRRRVRIPDGRGGWVWGVKRVCY